MAIRPDFAGRMAGFVAHLRLNGFRLGHSETLAALALVEQLRADRLGACRLGLKILLAGGVEDWTRFDELFEAWWFARGRVRERLQVMPKPHVHDVRPAVWQEHLETADARSATLDRATGEAGGEADLAGEAKGRLVAGERDTIRRTDLRHLSDAGEIAEAERVALRLARAMRYRLSRRYRPDPRRRIVDLRKTIRASLSKGGDPLDLVGRSRPHRPVEIVLFVDVSGSMQPYTRFFLQFVAGLVGAWPRSDAYLFHTRLVRVTDAVRERDPVRAMGKLSLVASGIGGGTRLGHCLKTFNDSYAKAALNPRTVFIAFSDGYDTEPPERLAEELARLRKRARRIVWLNPLIGWRDYAPVTAAMAAALPLIDRFAPAHTLDALAAVEGELASL